MLRPIVYCVIVSLPEAYCNNVLTYSKNYYTTPYKVCQQELEKSTLDYNYITTEEFIQSNNKLYQDIFW